MRLFYCTCLSWAYYCTRIVGSLGSYTNASSETTALSGNLTSVASLTAERVCYIAAPTVQVLYFPPGNRTVRDATTVVSSNYTFTSPSLYVVYPTISADDMWEFSGILKPQIGAVYYNVTRAYPPNALRTFPADCYHGFLNDPQGPPTLKVEDLIHPPQNWITGQLCQMVMGHVPGYGDHGDDEYPNPNGTEMAAFPNLVLPEEMSTYDPAWSGCVQNTAVNPVWDPPRALTPAAVMVPSTTTHPSSPSSTADLEWQSVIPMPITRPATIPSAPAAPAGPGDSPKITQSAGVIPAADDGADDEHGNADQEPDVAYTSTKRTEQGNLPIIEPPSRSVVVIGHHTVYALPDGRLSVDSMRITPGAPEITVDGLPVSQDDSAIYVAGSSYMLYSASVLPSLDPPPLVGGQHMEALSDGKIAIGRVTIAPGSQVTIAGNPISVDALYVVYGSSTYAKPPVSRVDVSGVYNLESVKNADDPGVSPAPVDTSAKPMVTPPPLAAYQKISKLANGAILVEGSTIPLGGQVTVSNTPISVGSSVVVVDGTTYGLPISLPPGLPILIDGQRIWRDSNGDVVIGSVTLSPGSQTTIAGTPVSVGSTFVAVAGSTFDLAPSQPTYTVPLIGGQTVSKAPDGAIVVGSLTLRQGSQTTISGTAVSVGSNDITIDGTSYALPLATENSIYIDGQSFERLADGNVVIDDGQILSVGAQTTVSGLPISVGVTDVVIAGNTYAVVNQLTSAAAVGAMIASMFGFVSSPTNAVGSAQTASRPPSEVFLGVGASWGVDVWVLLLSWLGGVAFSAALYTI